jgi:hypothetical protein
MRTYLFKPRDVGKSGHYEKNQIRASDYFLRVGRNRPYFVGQSGDHTGRAQTTGGKNSATQGLGLFLGAPQPNNISVEILRGDHSYRVRGIPASTNGKDTFTSVFWDRLFFCRFEVA